MSGSKGLGSKWRGFDMASWRFFLCAKVSVSDDGACRRVVHLDRILGSALRARSVNSNRQRSSDDCRLHTMLGRVLDEQDLRISLKADRCSNNAQPRQRQGARPLLPAPLHERAPVGRFGRMDEGGAAIGLGEFGVVLIHAETATAGAGCGQVPRGSSIFFLSTR